MCHGCSHSAWRSGQTPLPHGRPAAPGLIETRSKMGVTDPTGVTGDDVTVAYCHGERGTCHSADLVLCLSTTSGGCLATGVPGG